MCIQRNQTKINYQNQFKHKLSSTKHQILQEFLLLPDNLHCTSPHCILPMSFYHTVLHQCYEITENITGVLLYQHCETALLVHFAVLTKRNFARLETKYIIMVLPHNTSIIALRSYHIARSYRELNASSDNFQACQLYTNTHRKDTNRRKHISRRCNLILVQNVVLFRAILS